MLLLKFSKDSELTLYLKEKANIYSNVAGSLVNQRDEMVNPSDNIANSGWWDLCHFQFSPNFLLVLLQRGPGPPSLLQDGRNILNKSLAFIDHSELENCHVNTSDEGTQG